MRILGKLIKWLLRGVVFVVVLVALIGVGLFFWLRTSQPRLNGEVAVLGIQTPVTITRDKNGIPYINAKSRSDAYFALGYVHAQDRLFQMEMQRRIGKGRLSEAIGSMGLRFDRLKRTLGVYRAASESFKSLDKETQDALTAYAAGVNSWVKTRKGPLPPEFTLLMIDFEPWKPADSIVWGKLMALQLSGNWRNELLRMRLVEAAGKESIPVLFPPYPGDGPATIKNYKSGKIKTKALDRLWAALPHSLISNGASNTWVVSGKRTVSGKPILANDPHLGLSSPTLWYLVRVTAPGMSLSGASVPGSPALIIGHNDHIAWGVTTTYIDTDDLFIEKIDPKDPTKYLTPEGSKSFKTRKEKIKVRFGDDVTLTIRETRHGPVIDLAPRNGETSPLKSGHVLALSAPWLTNKDTTAEALLRVNRARNWDGFTEAMKKFIGPLQNFSYADVEGNIGYLVPGRIPVRRAGNGYMPQPGWKGEFDWVGFIPFDGLPKAFNPKEGYIVSANNKIVGKEYPYFLSREWGDSYRAKRIEELLKKQDKHTPASIAKIQADIVSLSARDMLVEMLKIKPKSKSSKRAVERLGKWDGTTALERPEPLIYFAWLRELNKRLYTDELGSAAPHYIAMRPSVVMNILKNHPDWCDNKLTAKKETCAQIIETSLDIALTGLTEKYGADMALWRWGEEHYATFRHPVFSLIPGIKAITRIRIATGGANQTVNKTAMYSRDGKAPFAARHGAGYRGIYPFKDLKSSLYTLSTGQSGNPYSPYWDNLVKDWRDVKHLRFSANPEALKKNSIGTLTLVPGQKK